MLAEIHFHPLIISVLPNGERRAVRAANDATANDRDEAILMGWELVAMFGSMFANTETVRAVECNGADRAGCVQYGIDNPPDY